ncbi:cupredoxin domain-containing protein [Noviherbaspirillum sp. Root189]|uniref:cupredoxin domain-containing protein n=1 Tax=Noviherbaspirillum sp. Root189 TaxID=1736487 RepID=UPI00070E1FD8|nr:cupredoxin family protein [Noviherbaspirillum sp. Root189]KRB88947.1 plastocyanin [Noviherbaspirillum sp. Root189]
MNKQNTINTLSAFAMSLMVAVSASPAYAHTGEKHIQVDANAKAAVSTDEHAFGKQGDPKNVTRTIVIGMSDTMRFDPVDIAVKAGETIKFVVTNKGQMMHEMVIGTMDELKAHGELMKRHPGMEHDEPYMSHVGPGKKEQMVWQFTKAGEYYYACLIPGHFEAGMVGKITVKKG